MKGRSAASPSLTELDTKRPSITKLSSEVGCLKGYEKMCHYLWSMLIFAAMQNLTKGESKTEPIEKHQKYLKHRPRLRQ